MKRKYLALFLACVLCTSVFVSGCGNSQDTSVEDDDDDDDDDDWDDDDEEDDDDDDDNEDDSQDRHDTDEEEKPVYVRSIDKNTLLSQIKVFVKNKEIWSVPATMGDGIYNAAYSVTDLDHNGRAELLVLTESDYSDSCTVRVFEISENGDSFTEAEWEYSGIDVTRDNAPDLINHPFPETYYDEKSGQTHYITHNTYDNGNGDYGTCMVDFTYSNGKVSCYTFAALRVYESYDITTDSVDYRYVYYDPDGEASEEDFIEYLDTYPEGFERGSTQLGIYYRGWYEDYGVMELEDAFLKELLNDSYRVFTDEYPYEAFYKSYNDAYAPGSGDETFYERCIGTWYLWYSEVEGDVTYYEVNGPQYATLEIRDDYTAVMTQYKNGRESLVFGGEIYFENDRPYFDYSDRDALPEGFMMERYTLEELNSDGDQLTVYLDFYGEDGILGWTTLVFLNGAG
ncbi:MAG: hypothetical protein K5871_09980 [Lachnospiraceae bacterium]|nr:hypothetical protein [Lachnospiraceae bacterium]